jgi:hypothetical protein
MSLNYHGRVWNDRDLLEPYKLGSGDMPRFRFSPTGPLTIYKIEVEDADIDFLDNPFEHKLLRDIILPTRTART